VGQSLGDMNACCLCGRNQIGIPPQPAGDQGEGSRQLDQRRQAVRGPAEEGDEQGARGEDREHAERIQQGRQEVALDAGRDARSAAGCPPAASALRPRGALRPRRALRRGVPSAGSPAATPALRRRGAFRRVVGSTTRHVMDRKGRFSGNAAHCAEFAGARGAGCTDAAGCVVNMRSNPSAPNSCRVVDIAPCRVVDIAPLVGDFALVQMPPHCPLATCCGWRLRPTAAAHVVLRPLQKGRCRHVSDPTHT